MNVSRREVLWASLGALGGLATGWTYRSWLAGHAPTVHQPHAVLAHASKPTDLSANEVLAQLKDGNRRFAEGACIHPHESCDWRARLVEAQHPHAVVLGCSDSRVAPEVVFDEGLGELFVVRQAGHVADDDTLGSIEYAVAHLHVPLVVVLGHEHCGAVTAAVAATQRDEPAEGHMQRLVDDIAPAVPETGAATKEFIDQVARANVGLVVRRLRSVGPILRPCVRRGQLRVVGAYYHLDTGQVEWLDC
ncbi:MAG TPA: carbonic anhydrase [Gemmatales bacterium]|nr:carbonic anhydrase [Gemmatales bacterium]HMP60349.1 carbonic anhydrase [Gemmatales bacterium]